MSEKRAKNILIVDDEPEIIRAYGEILTDLGYVVHARNDAASALALLNSNPEIDLVVTDYRMSGMNGIDFIVALRMFRPLLPVVLITAYGNIETYLHSMSLGAFDYVNKPIKKQEFERIVQNALNDKHRKKRPGKGNDEFYTHH